MSLVYSLSLADTGYQTSIIATIGIFSFFNSFITPLTFSSGPKVNTVEKLAALRHAGVNVGACRHRLQNRGHSHTLHLSSHELLPWVL